MSAKKKKPAARRRTSMTPSPVVSNEEAIYVKVPLSPEAVSALREHAGNAANLKRILDAPGEATVEEFAGALSRLFGALDRDIAKLRGRR